MQHLQATVVVIYALLLAGFSIAPSAKAASFDGAWNVQIASSNGACRNAASVSIGINNGHVASNNATVSASGHVAYAGTISVTLRSGMKQATGVGQLTATSGSGTWRGGPCSGTWTAQRI